MLCIGFDSCADSSRDKVLSSFPPPTPAACSLYRGSKNAAEKARQGMTRPLPANVRVDSHHIHIYTPDTLSVGIQHHQLDPNANSLAVK